MLHCIVLVLLGVSFYLAAAPAWGDLPSLMSDKPAQLPATGPTTRLTPAPTEMQPARLLGVESPLKGKLSVFSSGDMDYRFNRSGIKTSLRSGGTSFDTSFGYGGERRLELSWRTGGGRLKLAAGADERLRGYRLEFTRDF